MDAGVTATWFDSVEQAERRLPDGAHFCTCAAWARGWQRVRTERVEQFRHLLLESGAVREHVPYYLVDGSPMWSGYEDDAGVPPVWRGPVVYSSTVYGEYGGAGGGTPEHLARAVDLGLAQTSRWGAGALVFTNLTTEMVRRWLRVRPEGVPVQLDRAHTASLRGGEQAFLRGIRSKVRREFIRQWQRAGEAGLRLRVLPGREMLPELDAFTDLASAAAQRHGYNPYGIDIFHHLVDVPGARLLVADLDGHMAGAFYCFRYGDRFYLATGGLDYDRVRELNTYAFLMYESMRHGIATGADVLDPGRGNFRYKERHGFTGTDLWALTYLTESDPVTTAALERMGKGIDEFIARKSRPHAG